MKRPTRARTRTERDAPPDRGFVSLSEWNARRGNAPFTEVGHPDLLSPAAHPTPPGDPWSSTNDERVVEEARRLVACGALDAETVALLDRTIDEWLDQWTRAAVHHAERAFDDDLSLLGVHNHNRTRAQLDGERAQLDAEAAQRVLDDLLTKGGLEREPQRLVKPSASRTQPVEVLVEPAQPAGIEGPKAVRR